MRGDSIDGHIAQQRQFIERLARAHHDRRERVVGECDRQAGLLAQQHVEVAQECSATRKHDSLLDYIGGECRRRAFERDTHRLDDLIYRFHQRLADLLIGNLDNLGNAGHEVAPLYLDRLYLVARVGRADRDLDEFSGAFADKQIVFALDVLDDRLVHLVPGHAHRAGENHSGKRNHGDLGGAAADINNHVARGLGNWESGADSRRHRFLDQVYLPGAGGFGRLAQRALFDPADARGGADHDPRADQITAVVGLLNEVAQHAFGNLEVSDDAVLERTDRDDRTGRTAENLLGFGADGENAAASTRVLPDRHHRGLIAYDTLALDVDQRVGGSQINGEIFRKPAKHSIQGHRIIARSSARYSVRHEPHTCSVPRALNLK